MISAILPSIVLASLGSAITPLDAFDLQKPFSQSSLSLNEACDQIATSVSAASQVYSFAFGGYLNDISHWASSSTQIAACSFEPGTPEDIGVALRIIGQTKTPFAVKGGGHTANPGFSSTEGVQIAMTKYSDVVYDPDAQTATIGAGLIWDTVYAALEPHGVNVVGGRVPGVGVAGFTLGGGYSWLTNQFGLTIDTVLAYELVMPNGTALNVTETSSPDLFFALKGGLNNFGIVTRFTLKTFPQTQIWGGAITFTENVLDQVIAATANFSENNTDPKAAILITYNHLLGLPGAIGMFFYDAPTLPTGTFDQFLAIPSLLQDVTTRSFSSFVASLPSNAASGTRAVFNTISVTDYSVSFLQAIVNETIYWGKHLPDSVFFVSYDVEPFLPTLFSHNSTSSAYPPDRTRGLLPLNIYYAWLLSEHDQAVQDAIRASARALLGQVTDDGLADAAVYPNYAIFDTPVANLYGANLERLKAIKAAVDPGNVMGLAGGFKL